MMYTSTDTRSIVMGQLPKNKREAGPMPHSPISQEEDTQKQNSKRAKQHKIAHVVVVYISHY